jgi:hypothetical protein
MPKKPKKAPTPVPSQDETQFKASMVVDAKPKIKKVDIFEDMTDSQKKREKHHLVLKAKMKESKERAKSR